MSSPFFIYASSCDWGTDYSCDRNEGKVTNYCYMAKKKTTPTEKPVSAVKRNRKTQETISPLLGTDTKAEVQSPPTEHPKAFKDYVEAVKELIGGNEVLYKVISQDFTGDAAKYKGTVFGNLERDLISQCYRLGLDARTCAGHLWLMKDKM